MADPVPKAVVQERYERLVALQEDISWQANLALAGREVEVLVGSAGGRKATGRLAGRARDGRLVHLAPHPGVRPGDLVTVTITHAAPHHLIADGEPVTHRRTRAGDVWDAAHAAAAGAAPGPAAGSAARPAAGSAAGPAAGSAAAPAVSLGMPRLPAPATPAPA
jgi:tRNA-2-methylthio-N6-dimethylallyladenosine synthase